MLPVYFHTPRTRTAGTESICSAGGRKTASTGSVSGTDGPNAASTWTEQYAIPSTSCIRITQPSEMVQIREKSIQSIEPGKVLGLRGENKQDYVY